MANSYHEPIESLSADIKDINRAIDSLKEEIEAVGWYSQRVAAATNEEIKEVMWHNAMEEMEHAMMLLEWLRRNQAGWDEKMRTYLFTDVPIVEIEGAVGTETEEFSSLGIGEL